MPRFVLVLFSVLLVIAAAPGRSLADGFVDPPRPVPLHYIAYRAAAPVSVDGRITEAEWRGATWTDDFVDIEGALRPKPRFRSRARMLWDADYLYLAFDMEEPDLWATLRQRDTVIFHDNDIEVFIDPDGDTHAYYELEINALGTAWDLMLLAPYRDGGPAISAWDIDGMKVGVALDGTLNRPGDRDRDWTVEVALPWRILAQAARGRRPPRDGEQWRLNFSRVQWTTDVVDGVYRKRTDPATGRPLPEDNWVWSPQGAVNMHMPEQWGFVQFSEIPAGTGTAAFVEDPNERVKAALRTLYTRQRQYRGTHGRYAATIEELDAASVQVEGLPFSPVLHAAGNVYEITAVGFDGRTVHIRHDGRTWVN